MWSLRRARAPKQYLPPFEVLRPPSKPARGMPDSLNSSPTTNNAAGTGDAAPEVGPLGMAGAGDRPSGSGPAVCCQESASACSSHGPRWKLMTAILSASHCRLRTF